MSSPAASFLPPPGPALSMPLTPQAPHPTPTSPPQTAFITAARVAARAAGICVTAPQPTSGSLARRQVANKELEEEQQSELLDEPQKSKPPHTGRKRSAPDLRCLPPAKRLRGVLGLGARCGFDDGLGEARGDGDAGGPVIVVGDAKHVGAGANGGVLRGAVQRTLPSKDDHRGRLRRKGYGKGRGRPQAEPSLSLEERRRRRMLSNRESAMRSLQKKAEKAQRLVEEEQGMRETVFRLRREVAGLLGDVERLGARSEMKEVWGRLDKTVEDVVERAKHMLEGMDTSHADASNGSDAPRLSTPSVVPILVLKTAGVVGKAPPVVAPRLDKV